MAGPGLIVVSAADDHVRLQVDMCATCSSFDYISLCTHDRVADLHNWYKADSNSITLNRWIF